VQGFCGPAGCRKVHTPPAAAPSPDEEACVSSLEAECDRGNADACYDLGSELLIHRRSEVDIVWVGELFQRACDLGSANGCAALALMVLSMPHRVPPDTPPARQLLEGACERGSTHGCGDLAIVLLLEDDDAGEPRAFELLEGACTQGVPNYCYLLGRLHEMGIGTERDEVRAREVLDLSCQVGADGACLRLADMWVDGRGGEADEDVATDLFGAGCSMLFGSLADYAGTDRDLGPCDDLYASWIEAARSAEGPPILLLSRACGEGSGGACFLTGWLWKHEIETYRNSHLPGHYMEEACERGFAPACRP